MKSVKGFTLIELMVTIAVLAIIISLAVPSFNDTLRRNRAEAQSDAVVAALNLARSEAVKRGRSVAVTPVGNTWTGGWQIIAGTEVVRVYPALQGSTMTGPTNVVFNSRGQVEGLALGNAVALQYRVVGTGVCRFERDIGINAIGRVSSVKGACS